jgi:hypothetical protein
VLRKAGSACYQWSMVLARVISTLKWARALGACPSSSVGEWYPGISTNGKIEFKWPEWAMGNRQYLLYFQELIWNLELHLPPADSATAASEAHWSWSQVLILPGIPIGLTS